MTSTSAASDKIYWTTDSRIQRSNLDGTGVENLITGLSQTNEVAVNVKEGKLYWADHGTYKIQRANLDGNSVEDIVTDVETWSIAIDADAGKIYWTEYSEDKVQRANLDGSDVELLYDDISQATGIALDIYNGKMYWADDLARKIKRANLDGSQVEDVVTELFAPMGIAVDCYTGKLYWAEVIGGIYRADTDGTQLVKLVDTYVWDVTLDAFHGKLLWTNNLSDRIQRCDDDGSNLEEVALTANAPLGIALAMQNNSVPGDFSSDCEVDFADFAVFSNAWDSTDVDSHWNPNCDIADPLEIIDMSDLLLFTQNWIYDTIP